jgi:hypothetical protein
VAPNQASTLLSTNERSLKVIPKLLRFKDLKERGLVPNWTTLLRWIELEGFPAGIRLAPNTRAWTEDEVAAWLASRPAGRRVA